jgi:hypothetical protein
MPVQLLPNPQNTVTVTHLGIDYNLDCVNVFVRRKENGFDTGTLVVDDDKSSVYSNKVSNGDAVVIKVKDASNSSWTTILSGVVRGIDPVLDNQGNLVKIECDGAGYGFGDMLCAEEYGSEVDASLDTIKEIIEDAAVGIIPEYVKEILDTGVSSGFDYTSYVETITGTIGYIYFPYKPCHKSINDVCDIVQAIKGSSAGPHWIVDASNNFLLTTIGSHALPAAAAAAGVFWHTYYNLTQTASTLVEGVDFGNFKFNTLQKEANYVLYHGDVTKPMDLDAYSENNSASWGTNADCTISDEAGAGLFIVGAKSIKVTMDNAAGGTALAYYPSTMDLGLNINALGGKYSIPLVHMWAMLDTAFWGDTDNVFRPALFTSAANYFHAIDKGMIPADPASRNIPQDDMWSELTVPIGQYYTSPANGAPKWFYDWFNSGAADWTNINAVGIYANFDAAAHASEVWVDGAYFAGTVQRAARQTAAFSATDPCKMKLITDTVAKDDTLNAADDSGLVGRLLKAEYLRASSTPTVGTFTLETMAVDLLPGQLVHVHAKKDVSGSFNINSDFRVLRLIHTIIGTGYTTVVEVTSDVLNANPRPVPTQYNALLRAVSPENQTRQATSIKSRDIDITQPVLSKSY